MIKIGLYKLHLGKIATFLGVFSFICVVVEDYSLVSGNNLRGPLVNFIYSLTTSVEQSQNIQTTEALLKPMGVFDFHEDGIRKFLKTLSIIFAVFSGISAVFASKKERSSLWYSAAIFISSAALLKSNYLVAGAFVFICLGIIMKQRNWKLSKA